LGVVRRSDMSWVIISDGRTSCFGCDTMDIVWGNIYYTDYDTLMEFALQLPKDPRKYSGDELYRLYEEWENSKKLEE